MRNKLVFDKVISGLKLWTKINLLWVFLTFVLRLGFFFVLYFTDKIEWSSFVTILSGVYFDVTLVMYASIITLIPYLILYVIVPKTSYVVSMALITIYVIIYLCLIGYYSNVMLPLDRVFLVYTPQELYDIVVSSVRFSFVSILVVLTIAGLYAALLYFWRKKVLVNQWVSIAYLIVSVLFVCIFNYKTLITNDKCFKTYKDYCLAVNQLAYTANDFYVYWQQKNDYILYDESVLEDAKNMQKLFPEFDYVDIHYPFLRKNDDPDVLGNMFEQTTDGKAPDFVFIIVESLGQRLSSKSPKMSFTPFIDSLKQEGLYWPNCLALSERTFGVVPNIFSSAPYDKSGFARVWFPIPDHNSILKDMAKNGYSISFYYGGNAAFDGQNTYMYANGVGYVMDPSEADFDQEQKEMLQKDHSWGMYDIDMFNAAIKHREQSERNRPNTDIYITLSTHEPFYFRGAEEYQERVEKMVAQTQSFGPAEKGLVLSNKEKYASYLYADDCIRHIFDYYKKQPEFENTIFVVTGDHRMGRVYVNASPLLKYNVPLVIYSPLLKEPKMLNGVVTHHDIAPTVTAYLKSNYDYSVDSECHWLGASLDTSSYFRCNQSVAFMLNNRDVVEYMHHGYMLDRDRLFEIGDSLNLNEIQNDSIKTTLKEYLRQYRNVDLYVTKNDFLVKKPDNLTDLFEVSDMKDAHHSVISKEKGERICDEYVFKENFDKVYVDAKFDYVIENGVNPQKVYIVFKINNNKGQSIMYKSFKFSEMSTIVENNNVLRTKTTFFLADKDVVGLPMSVSIYTEEQLEVTYKNIKIRMEGWGKRK